MGHPFQVASHDEIVFRRILAEPYWSGRWLREALDIEINGVSLSRSLEKAPFDVDRLRSDDAVAAWSRTGHRVPVLDCSCGDVECGGLLIDVVADDDTIIWASPDLDRAFMFDRQEFESSLTEGMKY